MGLLDAAKESRDTRDGDDCTSTMLAFLLSHLVRDSSGDEEGAVEVDLLRFEEQLVGHIQKGMEWADAGVGDKDVDSSESLD
jgi:hypothetical protein